MECCGLDWSGSGWLQMQSSCECGNEPSTLKLNSVALVREPTVPTERPTLVGEVSAKFANKGCLVVSAMDPHSCILCFLDRSRYFCFQVAPQLYSRGYVVPVPDPLLHRKSGPGVEPWPLDLQPGTLITRPQRRSF
jgi:hypothetical protein